MVNRTYADLARHYKTAILPARPYHPRDKAKVEVGVQIVGRWVLARLRDHRFFSLAALNEAIRGLLIDLNNRALRSWGRSRRDRWNAQAEKALTAVVQETYVQGVSIRAVDDLVQAMGMSGISKSQVSRLCAEIDDKVKTFLGRQSRATGRICGSTRPT
jgi:hypothetical protein